MWNCHSYRPTWPPQTHILCVRTMSKEKHLSVSGWQLPASRVSSSISLIVDWSFWTVFQAIRLHHPIKLLLLRLMVRSWIRGLNWDIWSGRHALDSAKDISTVCCNIRPVQHEFSRDLICSASRISPFVCGPVCINDQFPYFWTYSTICC